MKLQINAVQFHASDQLTEFLQQKIDKLDTFYDRIIEGEVYLKLDNNNQISNKIVEIKLFVPGTTLFTKEEADSFETATDKALDSMSRQLKKYKDKITTH